MHKNSYPVNIGLIATIDRLFMNKKLSFLSLMILIIAAIDNIRNLPAAALFGTSLIFFTTISAIFFLIPTSLVSAQLSSSFTKKGGVCHWVNHAFGEKWAMVAIWLQWINTMVWYPTMLSFIAGTLAYLIDPALVQNKFYLVSTVLIIFWGLTFLNMKGIHTSAFLNNLFCIIGTMFPLLLLIGLGAFWYLSGHPLQIDLNMSNLIPPLTESTSWVSLIAIMASFLGMELTGVHVNDIDNPQKNFPRAVLFAGSFIFISILFGSLAIAFVLPNSEINFLSGVMQIFSKFFEAFGIPWLTPIITLLLVIGSTGMMINWLISPAKGLLHAAEFGFLPKIFLKKNKHDVAVNILLAQAILVTIFCLLFLVASSVNGFYWFFTALSTELYMGMYLLMFCAAIKFHYMGKSHLKLENTFKIPGGSAGLWLTCLCGLVGCLTTIVVSFFPPDHINIGSSLQYLYLIIVGNILALSPLLLFYWYRRKNQAIGMVYS